MIRSLFVIAVTFAYILITGIPTVLFALLTRKTDPVYRVGVAGARMALYLAGVRMDVHGSEKIPRDRNVVFMPNHQSNCDPPATLVNLPPVLAMAKREFFRVPILGRAMLLRGFIPVERKNRERAIAAVEKAVDAIKAGNSFLCYPEGTRSPDGRLQPFKKGVFVMAIKAGVPIVPISLSGTSKIMRKGEVRIRPGTIRITFHDPVPTAGFAVEDRGKVIELVRSAIMKGLTDEEQPLPVRASHS